MSVLLSDLGDAAPGQAGSPHRGLAYALGLRLRLHGSLGPRQSCRLRTHLTLRPQTSCLICFAHVPERSTLPLVFPFVSVRHDENPTDGIELELYNPSPSQTVAPDPRAAAALAAAVDARDDEHRRSHDHNCVFVLVFAIPLPSLHLDPLPLQSRDDDPRPRGLGGRLLVSATPMFTPDLNGGRRRGLRILARQIVWHVHGGPRPSGTAAWPSLRHGLTVTVPVSRDSLPEPDRDHWDPREYSSVESVWTSDPHVYLEAAAVVSRTGTLCLRFTFTPSLGCTLAGGQTRPGPTPSAPETLTAVLSLVAARDRGHGRGHIRFMRNPATLGCHLHRHGLRVYSPDTVLLPAGRVTRVDLPSSYASDHRYFGLFVPRPSFRAETAVAVWRERHALLTTFTSRETTHLRQGQDIGDVYFVSRSVARPFPTTVPIPSMGRRRLLPPALDDGARVTGHRRTRSTHVTVKTEPALQIEPDRTANFSWRAQPNHRPDSHLNTPPEQKPKPRIDANGDRRRRHETPDDVPPGKIARRASSPPPPGIRLPPPSPPTPPSTPSSRSTSSRSASPPSPKRHSRGSRPHGPETTTVRLYRDPETPGALELVPARLFFALRALPPILFSVQISTARDPAPRGSPKKIARIRYFDIVAR